MVFPEPKRFNSLYVVLIITEVQLSNVAYEQGIMKPHRVVLRFVLGSDSITQVEIIDTGVGMADLKSDPQKVAIRQVLPNNPKVSLRDAEQQTGVSESTVQRFFHQ